MKTKKIFWALAFSVLSFWACQNPAGEDGGEKPPPEIRYKAGTYTASSSGYGGAVNLSIEFSASAIIAVVTGEHNESANRDAVLKALARIPKWIIEKQSAGVDIVSGATKTSRALIAAAEDCIAQAEQAKTAED